MRHRALCIYGEICFLDVTVTIHRPEQRVEWVLISSCAVPLLVEINMITGEEGNRQECSGEKDEILRYCMFLLCDVSHQTKLRPAPCSSRLTRGRDLSCFLVCSLWPLAICWFTGAADRLCPFGPWSPSPHLSFVNLWILSLSFFDKSVYSSWGSSPF